MLIKRRKLLNYNEDNNLQFKEISEYLHDVDRDKQMLGINALRVYFTRADLN